MHYQSFYSINGNSHRQKYCDCVKCNCGDRQVSFGHAFVLIITNQSFQLNNHKDNQAGTHISCIMQSPENITTHNSSEFSSNQNFTFNSPSHLDEEMLANLNIQYAAISVIQIKLFDYDTLLLIDIESFIPLIYIYMYKKYTNKHKF